MSASGVASLLRPMSVAVVGASEERGRFGGAAMHNLISHGFPGEIVPVTRSRDEVMGRPAAPSLSAIGRPVDTAIIIIPADATLDVIREAVDLGVSSAVVVASGFGEGGSGGEGERRLAALRDIVAGSSLTVLGPSTTGITNLFDRYVSRASGNQLSADHVRPGPLGLVSQSGAVNNILYNRAQARGVGIGYAVATGVQGFLTQWDVVADVIEDDRIEVVAMALEDAGPGARALPACRRAEELGKTIVALKLGRTTAGEAAIRSHSASLAGSWAVERAYLEEAGVVLVDDFDQLWEMAMLFGRWGPRPRDLSATLGVIAFSGGEGAYIADQAAEGGLELPPPSEAFAKRIAPVAPLADMANPFDPTGDVIGREEAFVECVQGFAEENDYGAYLVAAPIQGEALRRSMRLACRAAEADGRRIAASLWSVPGLSDGVEADLRIDGVPLFDTSRRALAAVSVYLSSGARPLTGSGPDAIEEPARLAVAAFDAGSTYWDAREALLHVGIPFEEARLVRDAAEAVGAAAELGLPVVVKGNVPNAVHKSAAGLVRIGLRTPQDVETAAREILHTLQAMDAAPSLVVERFVFATTQLYVGATAESDFGPAVLAGGGGTDVEAIADIAVGPARRVDREAARALLRRTRTGRFVDRDPDLGAAVADVVVRVAAAIGVPGCRGIDINPLMVDTTERRVVAADARLV